MVPRGEALGGPAGNRIQGARDKTHGEEQFSSSPSSDREEKERKCRHHAQEAPID